MTRPLRLTITTPAAVLVDAADVVAVRAEDDSGSFGILAGHEDLLTVLPASVVRWRTGTGDTRYCALRGGVLTVRDGTTVAIACREGTVGDDLAALEGAVATLRAAAADAEQCARVQQTRLHAGAVRQIMAFMRAGGPDQPDGPRPDSEARP